MFAIVLLHALIALLAVGIFFFGLRCNSIRSGVWVLIAAIVLLSLDAFSFMHVLEALKR